MAKHKDLRARLLKDPEVRRGYDALEEEFALVLEVAKARMRAGLSQAHENDAEHDRAAGKRARTAVNAHARAVCQGDGAPAED
jgi:hypothetical protein